MGLMEFLALLFPAVGAGFDFSQGERANQTTRDLTGQANRRLDRLAEGLNLNELYGNLPISYGGTRLAGPGSPQFGGGISGGGPAASNWPGGSAGGLMGGGIDIASLFQVQPNQLQDTLTSALGDTPSFGVGPLDQGQFTFDPSRLLGAGQNAFSTLSGLGGDLSQGLTNTASGISGDLAGLGNQVSTQLGMANLAPGSLFGAVDFPEFSGDARLASTLGGISAGQSAATTLAGQEGSGRALAGGQSIEQALGGVRAAERQIGGQAGLAAGQASANIEAQEQQHGLTQAATQAGLVSQEAQINAALQQAAASARLSTGTQAAGIEAELAQTGAGLESALSQAGISGLLGAETSAAGLGVQNMGQRLQAKIAERAQTLQAQGMGADEAFRRADAEVRATQADTSLGMNAEAQRLNAFMSMIMNPQLQLMLAKLGLGSQAANLTAGQQIFFPQFGGATQTGFQNLINAQMAGASAAGPKSGASLSIAGFGGGYTCIDGNSLVATPAGLRSLFHVKPGDEVYDDKMEPRKVLAVDYGTVPEEFQNEHVILATEAGSIILTKDHPIGGKPAGEWVVGDQITMAGGKVAEVVRVMPASYVVSGDLHLEGGRGYIADGFVVGSNLAKIVERLGVEAWDKIDAEVKAQHAQEA